MLAEFVLRIYGFYLMSDLNDELDLSNGKV